MNLDDFKELWQQRQQELDHQGVSVLERVRSRMTWFDHVIWRRDLRESLVAILLILWYGYDYFQHVTWLAKFGCLLIILSCVMIIVVLNWARLTGRIVRPDQPLQDYCRSETARVKRQIWLLRHVNWWYTGPIFVSVTISMLGSQPLPKVAAFAVTMLLPMAWFIHWLNQRAVAHELVPLRDELATALGASDEDGMAPDEVVLATTEAQNPKRVAVAALVIGWLALIGFGGFLVEKYESDQNYPKRSAFTDIRFDGDQVFVTYENKEYEWLAMDGIRVPQIVETAKNQFDTRWQKRIAEDLVEVLWHMNHQPGETVSLDLFDLEIKKVVHIESATMTEAKRNEIYRKRW